MASGSFIRSGIGGPVLTRGHGQKVELLLRRTGGTAAENPVPLALPATFAGELPCADCPGQRLVLTLFADHGYRLRRTYHGVENGTDKDYCRSLWRETDLFTARQRFHNRLTGRI